MVKQEQWISARGCVYNVNYHYVWSVKYRRKVLTGKIVNTLKELHESIAQDNGIILHMQEIMPDHVHLFITAHPKFAPATIVKIMKGVTAKKLFETYPELRKVLWKGHLWNPSYYVGTCGDVTKDVIQGYIETQKVK
ncbi:MULTISPECIES: IS200/IS605 family transposase [unclassified Methanoculleus]|uniref:IS200/IS605 family transposase n=1 Tax=unclassified Methanoculleus TaxID=2619537 RepID=UPI0025FC0945|nr:MULTISPECIES: IS200/IS605 family transposase [unclassified Methanoculleus]MCK9318721.1 IS200/IS605 family transposase [Methanoculleus sp.]MDD2254216.1 IS200/IS605 family transposase [Methanoculleus sp.]MDD2786816.1 IS200/IS605 family transposase [Methanoculleus sp.]MDD3217277.1 IS200/IS605 family transposase [Methanoculleus sp.]MDD4314193.1 IS200/IS605 family transposase [Methanoculleus sp.]